MKKIIINSLVGILATTSLTGCLATKDAEIKTEQKTYKKTIKCFGEWAGKEIKVEGVSYLVVDNDTIKNNLDRAETLCTSNVTDMNYLFENNKTFNQDISSWDVKNVLTMRSMFEGASSFNQDIGNWNVYNVEDMYNMFYDATSFNQDIGNWAISVNTKTMGGMFSGATSFNQNLSKWCPYNLEEPLINGIPAFFVDKDSKMNKFSFQSKLPNFEYCTTLKHTIARDKRNNPDDYDWKQLERSKTETSNKLKRLTDKTIEDYNNR